MDECLQLKKVTLAALETCSLKDAEISALRRKMGLLMKDINELAGLVTANIRKRANAKIVRLLKYQLDLELVSKTDRVMSPNLGTKIGLVEHFLLVVGEINSATAKRSTVK